MQIIYQTVKPFDKLLKKQKAKPGLKYRPMYYVVEQPVDEGLLLYHTMTKAMLLLTSEETEIYKANPTTLTDLIELWFLVPESHDDRLLSQQIRNVAKMLEKKTDAITNYTILTTTDCNARCFYCFEKGRSKIPMSLETAQLTADYIINHCQGKKVSLHWFGGEPLYNKTIITLICQRLKDASVEYTSTMTSNGYLFDEGAIKEAKDLWHLNKVQITLDGTEKIYNRIKAYIYKDVNAFQRVIKNVHQLQKADIRISIRLNIDMHNADDLSELADELKNEFQESKNISVYMHALFEDTKGSQAMHDDQKRKYIFDKMNEIEFQLINCGLFKPRSLKRQIKTNRCMADNDNCIVIVPDGHIGKCEQYSENNFVGHVKNKNWDTQMIENFKSTRNEIDACTKCFAYPDCFRLKLCVNHSQCYSEERNHELFKIRQSVLRAYRKFQKLNNQNEIQD